MFKFLLLSFLFLLACNSGSKKPRKVSTVYNKEITVTDDLTVLLFLNTECPVCRKYQGDFKPLLNKFGKECKFYFVFPGLQSDASIKDYCEYDSFPEECIVSDAEFNICKVFGATVTPQIMIFKNKALQYSGKIDDRFETISSHKAKATVNYIEKALFSLQKNEVVEINKTTPVGCFIEPD